MMDHVKFGLSSARLSWPFVIQCVIEELLKNEGFFATLVTRKRFHSIWQLNILYASLNRSSTFNRNTLAKVELVSVALENGKLTASSVSYFYATQNKYKVMLRFHLKNMF